jgi:putative hydroxymethylpyrimidine transport system substrate-binding protein
MTKLLPLAAALLLGLVVLAGCGEKEDVLEPGGSKRVELMLDYFPNADHAGIYAAQAAGYFEQAGLDVEIRTPPDPSAPIKQVAAGNVDLAISYEPEVFRAREIGLNVVSIAAVVQKPLTSIISLPQAKIRRPRDLKGKTVGTAGIDYQTAYLETILAEAGVNTDDVKIRNVGFNLTPALLTGRVDATLGAFWNYEGTDLKLRGKKPQIIRMEEAGVPTYNELVLVANADALERDGGKLRAFIGALSRGTRDLREDPDEAIKGLLDANPDLDPELQREVVDVTLPLFFPPEGKPYGWQDPEQWDAFSAWMRDSGLLDEAPDPAAAHNNRLLPGAGL